MKPTGRPIGSKESKAVPVFFSVEDITRSFDRDPTRLVGYVGMGFSKSVSIVGVHIAQLANKVGVPLKSGGAAYSALPANFYKPENFENMGTILTLAYRMFPDNKMFLH